MIKELIEEVTFDKITLSQALTRAKLIAYKIDNTQFKEWLHSEINGYIKKDLPKYRIINCDVFAEISNPFHGKHTVPFDVTSVDKDLKENSLYKMNVTQSIPTLETGLKKDSDHDYGYEYLPMNLVQGLKSMSSEGEYMTAVKRRIQLSEIKHIVETTKQKLIDTLLELNDAFPNLENDFSNDSMNHKKAQTIINHNIYGNYANSNIGIGDEVNQTINNQNKFEKFIEEIKKMGIEDTDIKEVEKILKDADNQSLGKKLMGWIGKVSTKAIEKGIELQVPLLIEKVQEII